MSSCENDRVMGWPALVWYASHLYWVSWHEVIYIKYIVSIHVPVVFKIILSCMCMFLSFRGCRGRLSSMRPEKGSTFFKQWVSLEISLGKGLLWSFVSSGMFCLRPQYGKELLNGDNIQLCCCMCRGCFYGLLVYSMFH